MIQELHDAHNGINIPETWVPDSTYWLVTDENKIVGVVNIRHSLTDHLFNADTISVMVFALLKEEKVMLQSY